MGPQHVLEMSSSLRMCVSLVGAKGCITQICWVRSATSQDLQLLPFCNTQAHSSIS